MPIGPLELIIILLIVLVVFGGKRLPALGRQIGGGMREFMDSVTGDKKSDDPQDAAVTASRELPPSADTPSGDGARSAERAFGGDA